jgi:FO synthase
MGHEGVKACLRSGANDLGGTLMDETITRSAGASNGQEMTPTQMEHTIRSLGRIPRQRTTVYDTAPEERYRASFAATRHPKRSPLAGESPPMYDEMSGRAAAIDQGAASAT